MTNRRAFTLVELLVALAIVTLLLSIALPVLSYALATGRRSACLANLRSFGQSLTLYRNDHRDLYPAGGAIVSIPLRQTSLLAALTPYVETPAPALGPDGTCSVPAPFRCRADHVCAPVHGMSYLYGIGELAEVLTLDGERDAQRAASRLADSDPATVIFSDMGDRELSILGNNTPWHPGDGNCWRNALYPDGHASRMLASNGPIADR